MRRSELLTVLRGLNTACLKCKQPLLVFSSKVVEGLCHTWALIAHEGTGTSGPKAKGKAQRTRRQAGHTCAPATSEVVNGKKASPPQRTPARQRAPLSSSDETFPRCSCTNALIRTANKSGAKKKRKIASRQGYQNRRLLRLHYSEVERGSERRAVIPAIWAKLLGNANIVYGSKPRQISWETERFVF